LVSSTATPTDVAPRVLGLVDSRVAGPPVFGARHTEPVKSPEVQYT
jgi:hypothetical protein